MQRCFNGREEGGSQCQEWRAWSRSGPGLREKGNFWSATKEMQENLTLSP